jgi:hypothetical protein
MHISRSVKFGCRKIYVKPEPMDPGDGDDDDDADEDEFGDVE